MTPTKACNICGEAKPVCEFGHNPSGNLRGRCNVCHQAAVKAAKARYKAKRAACPERQAVLAERERVKRETEAKRAAAIAERERVKREKAAKKADVIAERARAREERMRLKEERARLKEAKESREAAEKEARFAAKAALRREREEREATLRDDIWDAMRRGRAIRTSRAVRPRPTGAHKVKLRHEGGYVSAAELACRCVEREACYRAARICKTYEAAAAAIRILEQGTPALERAKALRLLWRTAEPAPVPAELQELLGGPHDNVDDPFAAAFEEDLEEALGDWAPAWMSAARASWPETHTA